MLLSISTDSPDMLKHPRTRDSIRKQAGNSGKDCFVNVSRDISLHNHWTNNLVPRAPSTVSASIFTLVSITDALLYYSYYELCARIQKKAKGQRKKISSCTLWVPFVSGKVMFSKKSAAAQDDFSKRC